MNTDLLHPLSAARPGTLLQLVSAYGCQPRFIPRLGCAGLVSVMRQPFTWYESVRYRALLREQAISPDPVFIIGHWRSGTTHLQNLMAQDPQFGGVTLLQAAMPNDFLTLSGSLTKSMQKLLPKKRLMDAVPVSTNAPWEEEMALAGTGRLSFYHVSFFPDHIEDIFRTAVLLNDNDPEIVREWRDQYLSFLRKVQFVQPGQRLLLKNPANTARIELLRQMFPGARFIHIHRDPYKVFASTMHLYLKAQEAWGLQEPNRERLLRHVLNSYQALMDAYFKSRRSLEPDELVEVSFRNLQDDPVGTLEHIYRTIGLRGFVTARPEFERYLDSQRHYRKNDLQLSPRETRLISQQWRNSFEQLGYTF